MYPLFWKALKMLEALQYVPVSIKREIIYYEQ